MKKSIFCFCVALIFAIQGCGNDSDSSDSDSSEKDGHSELLSCETGLADCDGNAENGCETVLFDLHKATCFECESGYGDCDENAENGCELNLESLHQKTCTTCADDYADCDKNAENGCEIRLSSMHRTSCTGCIDGYGDCDGDSANGCETDLKSAGLTVCPECEDGLGNCDGDATNGCESKFSDLHRISCYVCADGYGDCDGNSANGCETNLTNVHRSSCQTCEADYGDCDGDSANGCEMHLTDIHRTSCAGCEAGYGDCDETAANGCETVLSETNRTACSVCQSGYANCDSLMENGCETELSPLHKLNCYECSPGFVSCDNDLMNGCETELAPLHQSTCSTCEIGFGNCDNDLTNGCEIDTQTDRNNCGVCGHACKAGTDCIGGECINSCGDGKYTCRVGETEECVDIKSTTVRCGSCNNDCHSLSQIADVSCAESKCVINSCAEGYADCDGDPMNGCEVNSKTDKQHCGATGLCQGEQAGKECAFDEVCSNGVCKKDPKYYGCSDATREGFIDVSTYPSIAACGGAWKVPGIHHNDGPGCGRKSGNDGENKEGDGCNVEDLCAEGWHVCLGLNDVKSQTSLSCAGIMDGVFPDPSHPEPALFITRTSSYGNLNCAPDTAGTDDNMNDIFGCGNFGCTATGATCNPLELSSHNLCQALLPSQCTSCTAASCTGCSMTFDFSKRAHPLKWFAAINNKTYTQAWVCTGDPNGEHEARDVVKSQPNSQGGVMCCRNMCTQDSDCVAGKVCLFSSCVTRCEKDSECVPTDKLMCNPKQHICTNR